MPSSNAAIIMNGPPRVTLGSVVGDAAGASLQVDLDKLIASKLLLCANSGGGKSWTLRRLLESTFGQVPHHVIDPEGEFHTLRDAGFEYILAGKGYDCPTDPAHAGHLARKVLELGASVVLDLYELEPQQRVDFVAMYLRGLIDAPKTLWQRALIIIDEAHTFAPEKGEEDGRDVKACRSAVVSLMSLGRKRGFCGVLATQRLAKLSKSASADANNVLIGRTRQDVDTDRALKALGASLKNHELRARLRQLKPGHFFSSGPALGDEVLELEVGAVRSQHPEAGAQRAPASPPPAAVRKALAQLADLPQQAAQEARTVEELQARVRELEGEVRRGDLVSGWRLEDRTALEARVPQLEQRIRELEAVDVAAVARKAAEYVRDEVQHGLGRAIETLDKLRRLELDGVVGVAVELAADPESTRLPLSAPPPRPAAFDLPQPLMPAPKPPARARAGSGELTGPMQRVLDAIAWFESMGLARPDRAQIAFMAGYSPTSTSFTNPLSACRVANLVEYPDDGRAALTAAGRQAAKRATPPPPHQRSARFQEAVMAKMNGPQRRILTALLDGYRGLAVPREDLAKRAGYSATSTSFTNPLSSLHVLGLVTYPRTGEVAPAMILFPGKASS